MFDKTIKSQGLKKKILSNYRNYSLKRADTIVVCGGDGFMLSTIKKYLKFNKPFYGINCGSFGFLMNNYNTKNIEKNILKSKSTIINPLQIKINGSDKSKKKLIAINEVSLFRQSRQAASIKLVVGKKIILKKLIGDGVLVSTPAGSTAYNLSVHGPILSLNSEKLAITPISPFRPRRWRGKIISNKLKIFVKNLDPNKRPLAVVADNIEFRNIKSIVITNNKKIKINLLYDSNRSLVKKIKIEQIRKNTR